MTMGSISIGDPVMVRSDGSTSDWIGFYAGTDDKGRHLVKSNPRPGKDYIGGDDRSTVPSEYDVVALVRSDILQDGDLVEDAVDPVLQEGTADDVRSGIKKYRDLVLEQAGGSQ